MSSVRQQDMGGACALIDFFLRHSPLVGQESLQGYLEIRGTMWKSNCGVESIENLGRHIRLEFRQIDSEGCLCEKWGGAQQKGQAKWRGALRKDHEREEAHRSTAVARNSPQSEGPRQQSCHPFHPCTRSLRARDTLTGVDGGESRCRRDGRVGR